MMRRRRVVRAIGVLFAGGLTFMSLGGASSTRAKPMLTLSAGAAAAPVQQINGTHHGELIGAGMAGLVALRFAKRRNWRP